MRQRPGGRALKALLLVGLAAGPLAAGAGDDLGEARIAHALGRLGFGPRPGDLERVREIGLQAWFERQLEPERIPDEALRRRLAALRTPGLDSDELLSRYDLPFEAKRELRSLAARQAESDTGDPEAARRRRLEIVRRHADLDGSPRLVLAELQEAKLLRAVHGERQLEELMVDFWFNHFNVFADKGPLKLLLPEYERETIRPHALGRFEDLLLATARSPAMLFYLDNWLSADPAARERLERARRSEGFRRGRGAGRPAGDAARNEIGPRRSGLNENYARELLELHTLGVDGGYSQRDVTEVARCFSGWTIEGLREGRAQYRFLPVLHDPGEKRVLGRTIEAGGEAEGEEVIRMLARHPSTARHISYKLARRFVSDEPPVELVERLARTFESTRGDVKSLLRVLFAAPEFWRAPGAKLKTPFEFVASALRATGAEIVDARELSRRLAEMGMPLYRQQPPTGYKDTADAWGGASGLLARLNLSLDLAAGRLRGVRADAGLLAPASGGPDFESLAARLVPQGLSEATRRTLEESRRDDGDARRIAGLLLGSPEFQRR